MKPWVVALGWVVVFTVFVTAGALSCGDDDDDDDDDAVGPDGECPDFNDTTCLNYCECQRELCLEDAPEDSCNAQMCGCADFHGCLIEDVVATYDCQTTF